MQERILSVVGVMALALPLFTLAQAGNLHKPAFETLQSDAFIMQPGLAQDALDVSFDQAKAALEKGTELFPDLDIGINQEGASSANSEQSTTTNQEFVSFEENGVTVVLKDVPRQSWFAPYVRPMVERGVLSGYRDAIGKPLGEFRPGNPVTVEELAKMAAAAARVPLADCGEAKNTSAAGSWSAPFVACGERHHWSLFAEGSVDVRRPATRAEVVMTVLQAFQVDTSAVFFTGSGSLRDITASMAFGATVEKAIRDGIVSGTIDAAGNPTGYFRPNLPINRAEAAKILALGVQVYAKGK